MSKKVKVKGEMIMTDYYRVLGVKKNADADAIKKAFRDLAKKYHPDATGGDKKAEERFIAINEAYETLGDPEKRRVYDAAQANPPGGRAHAYGGPGGPYAGNNPFGGMRYEQAAGGGFSVDDLLNDLFGGTPTATKTRPRQSLDILATCDITPWLAALGGRIEVRVNDKTLSVKVPPNAKSGQKLRLRGQGRTDGGGSGDLVIELTIQNPKALTPEMRGLYERLAALDG